MIGLVKTKPIFWFIWDAEKKKQTSVIRNCWDTESELASSVGTDQTIPLVRKQPHQEPDFELRLLRWKTEKMQPIDYSMLGK